MRRLRPVATATALALAAGLLSSTAAGAAPSPREPDDPAAAAAATPGQAVIGDFEGGEGTESWDVHVTGGASGELSTASDSPAVGATHGRLTGAVPSGTLELARWPGRIEATALELSVRSSDVDIITVRLQDSTGQAHQQRFTLDPAAEGWQQIRITEFAGGASYLHFGGANDGVWHGPLQAFSIILDTWSFVDGASSGTLDVDGVLADVPTAPLQIETLAPGNGFHPGDDVAVGLVGEAEQVDWTVRDGFGTVVEQGTAAGAEIDGRLPLGIDDPGWYAVDIIGTDSDGARHLLGTDVAVLEPLASDAVRDPRFAVATHYGQSWPLATAELVAEAGFGLGRDEAYWYGQETTPGEIIWQDKVLAYEEEFDALGLGHFRVLSYGNPLYFEDEAPTTPEGREAFARYAVATVANLGTEGNVFEVWNEWNWRDLDGAAGGSAAQYVELLRVVHDRVKAEFPDAVLVGPALAPMEDWQGWFTEFAELGGLELVDAVSTHPYTFPNAPEGSTRFAGHWQTLRAIMADHGAADLPIHLSEMGWHTSETSAGTDEGSQARHMLRGHLVALADGIENVTIYDFMDDGTDDAEPEHRFGIVRNTDDSRGAWVPKPAYVSSAVMNRMLAGLPFEREIDLGDDAWDVVLSDGDRTVHAAWATSPTVAAVSASGAVEVTDMFGGTTTLTPGADGLVHVSLDGSPVYLEGDISDVTTSGAFALEVDQEISGTPTAGRVVVDNADGAARTLEIAPVGGEPVTAEVAAGGTATVEAVWSAQASGDERSYGTLVREDGDAIALLRTAGSPVPALELTGTHGVDDAGADTLRLRLTNAAATDLEVEDIGLTVGEVASAVGEGTVVPASSTITLDVPVEVTERTTWQAVATAAAADGPSATATGALLPVGETIAVPGYAVEIDGVADDGVRQLDPIGVVGTEEAPEVTGWTGPEDLSGSIWLSHEEEGLFLTLEVVDDSHAQPATGGDIWQGDGVQIGVVAGAPGEDPVPAELGVALTDDGDVVVHRWAPAAQAGTPEGVEAVVVRDDDESTTTYEVAFGWDALGIDPDGRLLSSTVVVNENDGDGRDGWLSWGLGLAESKNPALFQTLVLEPASEPEPQPELSLRTSVRAQCWGTEAVVAVHVVNTSDLRTDVRFSTAWGEAKVTGLAPEAAAYHGFRTGGPELEAGTLTVAAYSWNDGDPVYERVVHPFAAVSCG